MSTPSTPFQDVLLQNLKDPAEAEAYLDVAFAEFQEDGDMAFFLQALRNVAEAQGGISALAEKTHLNRQNLYKALSENGNPRLETVGAILRGMGLRLRVEVDNRAS